jgi:hypothetical protein
MLFILQTSRKDRWQLMLGLYAIQLGKEFYHGRSASIHIFER